MLPMSYKTMTSIRSFACSMHNRWQSYAEACLHWLHPLTQLLAPTSRSCAWAEPPAISTVPLSPFTDSASCPCLVGFSHSMTWPFRPSKLTTALPILLATAASNPARSGRDAVLASAAPVAGAAAAAGAALPEPLPLLLGFCHLLPLL